MKSKWTLVPWGLIVSGEVLGRKIRIIKRGDILHEGICTRIARRRNEYENHLIDVFIGGSSMDIAEEYYDDVNNYWLVYWIDENAPTLTNEGRTTCINCHCPTENRRDFLTFKVREFCPRCKI